MRISPLKGVTYEPLHVIRSASHVFRSSYAGRAQHLRWSRGGQASGSQLDHFAQPDLSVRMLTARILPRSSIYSTQDDDCSDNLPSTWRTKREPKNCTMNTDRKCGRIPSPALRILTNTS